MTFNYLLIVQYQIGKICLLAVIAFYTHFISIFLISNFPDNVSSERVNN